MTKRHRAIITAGISFMIVATSLVVAGVFASGFFTKTSSDEVPSKQPITSPTSAEQATLTCINALPDDVKVGQKLMVAAYSNQLASETPVLVQTKIGGIIVMDAVSAGQIRAYHTAAPITPFIAVDQEGGTVQRYTSEGDVPGAADMASGFSTAQAFDAYLSDDQYLKSIGVTTNFAPVVDVMSGSRDPLPGRMYSSDPGVVTDYASASIRAAKAAGITPVIKHFPGMGSATGNTDFSSATTDPIGTLQTRDLVPYQRLMPQQPDVMVGNMIVPGLTDGQPAVWSPAAVKLLREMGYQKAIVYTDSLTANAIPGTLSDAVVKAWQAGIDVALIVQTEQHTSQLGSDLDEIITHATQALKSGQLDSKAFSASLARIFDKKHVDACQL